MYRSSLGIKETKRIRRKKNIQKLTVRIAVIILIVFATVFIVQAVNPGKLLANVTVEAGTKSVSVDEFLREKQDTGKFITDMSKVDLSKIGNHEIEIEVDGKIYKSNLIIDDTVAPQGKSVNLDFWSGDNIPASKFVTDIVDVSSVKVTYKENPDFTSEGTKQLTVILEDAAGNKTELQAKANIKVDKEAPVITGAADLTVYIGNSVKYKQNIIVTDNRDSDIPIEVDNSKVNLGAEGNYDLTYSATDKAGNKATKTVVVSVKEKPDNYIDEATVFALADEILSDITTDAMTLREKAYEIYKWSKSHIGYVHSSEKDSWVNGAYQGLTKFSGDCFIYFATSKALLTRAGINNIDVIKSDTSISRHYWSMINIGTGWYHFDTTPRIGGGEFFMLTDEQLRAYSVAHKNSHVFNTSLYPATPKS
jgi:hypothetical protein